LSRRGAKGAVLGWLPVAGVLAALLLVPSSSGVEVAREGSLSVTPGSGQYGGTSVQWVATGLPANAKAHLQRTGKLGSPWADVEGSFGIGSTDGSGRIAFDFPSPAMNSVYFRVVAGRGATEAHHFTSKHQDAELGIVELTPAEKPLPQGVSVGATVMGEPFTLVADTKGPAKVNRPILAGRDVTLQRRVINGDDVTWVFVASGDVRHDDGKVSFEFGPGASPQQAGDYRVRLESWRVGGDDIGWFLTYPFELRVVDRPLSASAFRATAPSDTKVSLSWNLPNDPDRTKIVIARNVGGPANLRYVLATLPATATSYVDTSVYGSTTFNYAVYTVSEAGVFGVVDDAVYPREPERASVTTPAPPPPRGEG
jgi:hypothetical protein